MIITWLCLEISPRNPPSLALSSRETPEGSCSKSTALPHGEGSTPVHGHSPCSCASSSSLPECRALSLTSGFLSIPTPLHLVPYPTSLLPNASFSSTALMLTLWTQKKKKNPIMPQHWQNKYELRRVAEDHLLLVPH